MTGSVLKQKPRLKGEGLTFWARLRDDKVLLQFVVFILIQKN
jgi:hypothetical protein